MVQISVATFTEKELERFLEMSHLEYGPTNVSNSEHIRWKHLDSPFGASSYISLVESGRVFGRALAQPRTLRTVSHSLKVACVNDLLIDREHRTTPMNFINITKACGDVASFDLIYHTSNERSSPLYSKLLRISNPFSLRAYGFPVRFAGLFSSILGRRVDALDWFTAPLRWLLEATAYAVNFITKLDISQCAMGDDELELLCAKCLRQSGPHLARTNAFLKWRFEDAPLCPATVFRIDRKGHFLGYVATRKVEMEGLKHLILMDFVLDPDTPLLVQVALRLWLIRKAIASKTDALFTMVNSFSTIARKCVGFPLVNIPDRFLPHDTPLFMRARNEDHRELEAERSIHFTLADLDYF